MSMGSDLSHDPDTLRIHYDMREQHINLAGIKAMVAAARGIEPDLEPMGEAFFVCGITRAKALGATSSPLEFGGVGSTPNSVPRAGACTG